MRGAVGAACGVRNERPVAAPTAVAGGFAAAASSFIATSMAKALTAPRGRMVRPQNDG